VSRIAKQIALSNYQKVIVVLLCLFCLKSFAPIFPWEAKWKATLKIVDDNGNPVSDAKIIAGYYVPALPGKDPWSSSEKIESVSDSNGICVISHHDRSGSVWFDVKKNGFYGSFGSQEFLDGRGVPDNRTFELNIVLKKKIHPSPMYANRVDIAHREKPAFDKPVGFDLKVGDFVSPYGIGTNAHMFFTWHGEYDTNHDMSATYGTRRKYGWYSTMTITFPNSGDGIIEFDLPGKLNNRLSEGSVGSELRSPQQAPLEGYQSKLVKVESWRFEKLDSSLTNTYDHLHKNYIFRVNTVLDERGKVRSAQYGKIYEDFESAVSMYLNPETNSLSIEYDMEHNLGRGGKDFYLRY